VQVEPSAGSDQAGGLFGPPVDIRQPAEVAERVERVVHIAAHELRTVREPGTTGSISRRVDCDLREVHSRDPRTRPCPRKCVEPEVALEVDQEKICDITEPLAFTWWSRLAARRSSTARRYRGG
jgi:hypothetical protein